MPDNTCYHKIMSKRILAFSGSLRKESFNHKLVSIAAHGARGAGAQVTLIRLGDYPLPLFDEDLEAAEGMPEAGAKLKKLFAEHDALLIASPEYNGGYTAALKNAIDWVSRATEEDEPPLAVLANKSAAILAASPGPAGASQSSEKSVLSESFPSSSLRKLLSEMWMNEMELSFAIFALSS